MKKNIILVIAVLSVAMSFAQNGINYKAVVKDDSGNILASSPVTIQFIIYDGDQNAIYEEAHSLSTDANGLVMANIGEGSVGDGDFTVIDWESDDHYLNVQIDIGAGFVDFGFTQFKTVPYALSAGNVSGLEAIDEGNGIGWRLKGRDPVNHGNIGFDAIDLGTFSTASGNNSIVMGSETIASGGNSIAMGVETTASGLYSSSMGLLTIASGAYSTAMGLVTIASGEISTAMGANTIASGNLSTAMGAGTTAGSQRETTMGSYNTLYTPNSTTSWNATDRLFVIGNGTNDSNRSNALTVLKSGKHTIKSNVGGLVVNAGTGFSDDGITINLPGDEGITINSPGGAGIEIDSPDSYGIDIDSPGSHGILINSAGGNGVFSRDASVHGGFFIGNTSGVRAQSSNDANPDLILGGTSGSTAADDDGIISSAPGQLGSDIFLRSYDAVVVQLDFDNNEAGQFEIKNGNQVEVFEVDESGNVFANGYNLFSSDRRLKKDITDLPYGLKEVLQLKPKSYNWKNRTQDYKSLGLIAQEVQPIIREIVTAKDDEAKTLGVRYTELIPILINAIKEQNERIDQLEARLDSQENIELVRKD